MIYIRNNTKSATPFIELKKAEEVAAPIDKLEEEISASATVKNSYEKEESTEKKVKKSFFDKYIEKIKEFLDNAE